MPDPVIMAIATAVAGKVTESLTDQARQALAQITQRIHAKFRHQPDDLAVLDTPTADPTSPGRITQIVALLEQATHDDPAFGNDIRSLWRQVQIEVTNTNSNTTNIFNGQANKVIQIRDIQGGLTIN
jgi:hypothetical protein